MVGKGFSRQAYAIIPKIREVDDLLTANPRARSFVREVHPEICFWGLAGEKSMRHNKKAGAGFEERMRLLAEVLPIAPAVCDLALAGHLRKDVARDDIVDALVAPATALAHPADQQTLPAIPEHDARGLPMEMVYRKRA